LNDSVADIEMKSDKDSYGNEAILQDAGDDHRDANGDAPSWNKSYQGNS
jgi:hypothetical protein